jgi:phenylacetic acid degradation operon negative regulatory protein
VNARSALFDVYGDHLRPRGGTAPVAALLRILAALDVAAPAVRTAVSRMVRQGWLVPVRLDAGAGYRLTPQAERRLTAAAHRIYRRGIAPWDGRWHLLAMDPMPERSRRDRVRSGLGYLGYAPLRDNTWISPRASAEVDTLLSDEGVRALRFWAAYDGDDAQLAASAWDLDGIGRAYTTWLDDARLLVGNPARTVSDEEAFRVRSRLVHEWRKFLFRDPSLPHELLPPNWPGDVAAAFFDQQADRLAAGASRFVDCCLGPNPPS